MEASFGLSGVVSLYFFSVVLFLVTLALWIFSLARLAQFYRTVGHTEVCSQSDSQTVSSSTSHLQISSVALILSVPSVLSLYQMLTVLVPQASQFLHNVIQVYEAVVIHRLKLSLNTSVINIDKLVPDLLPSLWIGLEGKPEY